MVASCNPGLVIRNQLMIELVECWRYSTPTSCLPDDRIHNHEVPLQPVGFSTRPPSVYFSISDSSLDYLPNHHRSLPQPAHCVSPYFLHPTKPQLTRHAHYKPPLPPFLISRAFSHAHREQRGHGVSTQAVDCRLRFFRTIQLGVEERSYPRKGQLLDFEAGASKETCLRFVFSPKDSTRLINVLMPTISYWGQIFHVPGF